MTSLPYVAVPTTFPLAVLSGGLLGALPAVAVTVAAVFLTISLGAFLRRRHWLDEKADATLLTLLVRVFIPCLIVSRVLGNEVLNDWRNVVIPPAAAFGLVSLGFAAAGAVLWILRRAPAGPAELNQPRPGRTFILCTGMFNYGYVTIPLVQSMFDREGVGDGGGTLGVLFVFNVGVEAAMWGVGVTILAGSLARGWWKRLFSPPVVATLAALGLNVLDHTLDLHGRLPEVAYPVLDALWRSLRWLADAAVPTGLLLTGATIYEDWHQCRLRAGVKTVLAACMVRVVALPMVFLLLAVVLPVTTELKRVLVLQAAMPAAVFPIVLSRHYGGDVGTALRVVVGTSLASIVTMPFWISLGLWLIS